MTRYRNVVFLVLDSLRRDRVSLYNDGVTFTQHLAELGDESIIFDDAIAQAPWTLPSHASMFTGTYPWEHGATQQSPIFEPDAPTLVERFAGAGYRTAGYTPNPWVSPFSGLATGFDDWDNFLTPTGISMPDFVGSSKILEWWSQKRFERFKTALTDMADSLFETWSRRQGSKMAQTDRVLDRGKAFIERGDRSRPFFLYMNLLDAHEPYYPPTDYRKRHAEDVDPRDECQIPSRHLKGETEADFESISKLYDASVDYLDDAVGEFIAFLRRSDLLDDTVVAVLADHGQALGEDGLYGHQYGVGPVLTRVPMLVRAPGYTPQRDDRLFELRELFEYLPALAGLRSEYSPGVDIAKGGYGFPDLAIRQLPNTRREEFYNRYRFALDEDQYLVRTETEDEMTISSSGRLAAESVEPDPKLLQSLPQDSEGDRAQIEFAEPVENRLEELGYL